MLPRLPFLPTRSFSALLTSTPLLNYATLLSSTSHLRLMFSMHLSYIQSNHSYYQISPQSKPVYEFAPSIGRLAAHRSERISSRLPGQSTPVTKPLLTADHAEEQRIEAALIASARGVKRKNPFGESDEFMADEKVPVVPKKQKQSYPVALEQLTLKRSCPSPESSQDSKTQRRRLQAPPAMEELLSRALEVDAEADSNVDYAVTASDRSQQLKLMIAETCRTMPPAPGMESTDSPKKLGMSVTKATGGFHDQGTTVNEERGIHRMM